MNTPSGDDIAEIRRRHTPGELPLLGIVVCKGCCFDRGTRRRSCVMYHHHTEDPNDACDTLHVLAAHHALHERVMNLELRNQFLDKINRFPGSTSLRSTR